MRLRELVARLPGSEVFFDGPAPAKASSAGVLILLSALWEHALGLAVAIMLFMWSCDMLSGILRSIDEEESFDAFDGDRFWQGFRKLLAGGVAAGLGVAGDLLLLEGGIASWAPLGTGVTGFVAFGFFASALGNLEHFHPGLYRAVREHLVRGGGDDDDAGTPPSREPSHAEDR